jgi:hypothetical protein
LNVFVTGAIHSCSPASHGIRLTDTGGSVIRAQYSHLVKHNRLLFSCGIGSGRLCLVLSGSVVIGSHDRSLYVGSIERASPFFKFQ